MPKINLLTLGLDGLRSFIESAGMPGYRATQVARWIYVSGAESFEEMTNLSKADRERLDALAEIRNIELTKRQVSADGTEKYLFRLDDGEMVESVLIPEVDRMTLCISSQAGCALGCRFCLTGAGGIRRDLLPHEITGQVFAARKLAGGRPVTNLVLMGMGEPLMNRKNVFEALRWLTSDKMFAMSTRKITLSTAGVVPGIKELGESGIGINLAVSLNATTDDVRDAIMPINRKYPLKELIKALKAFPLAPRRRITIEYVMLKGINDSLADARRLAVLLRGLKCKVNLIPFNPHHGSEYKKPERSAVFDFQRQLEYANYTAFVRESRGADILAACGQLRADGAVRAQK